jgi:uncharacterized damage-inducible protein DinB
MKIAELIDLFDYNRWAHERTLDAAALLGPEKFARQPGESSVSVKSVLKNLLAEEVVWLSRWEGHSLAEFPDYSDCADTAALMTRWRSFWGRQKKFIESLAEDELDRPVAIRMRDGTETVQPLGETMTHVVNQATSLRGEAALLTRMLGGKPAAADYFTYCLERGVDPGDVEMDD